MRRQRSDTHCCHAGFPGRAQPHAHSMLCVSAATEQLRSLAATLQQNRYNVYSQALPSDRRGWALGDLNRAIELLLQDSDDSAADSAADSAGHEKTEPDLIMNEITAINGELQYLTLIFSSQALMLKDTKEV